MSFKTYFSFHYRTLTYHFTKNHEILGVANNANEKEIKEAFYKLAKKFHPDNNQGDESALKKFQEISNAYECILNMDRKNKNSDNRNQEFHGQEWAQKYNSEKDPRKNSNQSYQYYDHNYTYAAEASKKAQEAYHRNKKFHEYNHSNSENINEHEKKKHDSSVLNAVLGFAFIWIFCFVSSFYYVMEARNSEYQKGLQNVYYDTKKIIKLKDSADNTTESDTKSDHEKGEVLIGTNQIWR